MSERGPGELVLEEVVKEFVGRGAPVRAVDGVSIGVAPGTLVTLLGPSGCGKTTTLRLIAGFERPDAGRILLDGRAIDDVPANRRDMAMVFQSYAIFPHLDVFENIAYGLRVRRLKDDALRRKVGEVAELTGLAGLEHRQPNQLSGGQQQRVALARSLVMEPKVLLFDEPLSNLDAKLRVQMREQIRALQQRFGITAVYVTHDQAEAMVLSDLVVVMNRGRVEQAGTPFEVYRRPATAFVADFMGRANFVPGTVLDASAAGARVAALGTTLTVPSGGPPLAAGDPVTLVVRPNAVLLRDATDGSNGAPRGTIRRAWFVGPQHDYEVVVDGQPLAIVEPDAVGRMPRPPGSVVELEILADALAILRG
jgi:iron(III) transport system ATP-binding protein